MSLDTLGPKILDSGYMVVENLRIDLLVHTHRFLTVSDLKKLCVHHHIQTYDAKLDPLRCLMRRHSCTPHCTQPILVFRVSARPRLFIESRFVCGILDIPAVHADIPGVPLGRRGMNGSLPFVVDSVLPDINDLSHLTVPSLRLKSSIIAEWQDTLSVRNLQRNPCAVCAKLQSADSLEMIHAASVDLTLLRNDFLPIEVLPTHYDLHLYSRAILHVGGMQYTDRLGLLSICTSCKHELSKRRMPKFALCNWLYYGRLALPATIGRAFKESSVFERVLIARARSTVLSCRFGINSPEQPRETGTQRAGVRGNSYRHTMKGMRGNVVITPMDVIRLNECLPPPPETVRDTMCVILTGSGRRVTPETIESLYPILVRKTRLQCLISFLLRYNPHYAQVPGFRGFSSEYLEALFTGVDDTGVPSRVEIACIEENDALQAAVSGYVPDRSLVLPVTAPPVDRLLLENVGYTMDDRSPLAYNQMKKMAVQRCLDRNPYLNIHRGDDFVPDFNNPYILSWLLPHLDPWGIGGFYHPLRSRYLSMEEQLCHMLQMDDEYFINDPEFAFIFYNVIRKKNVSHRVRFSTPVYKYRRVVSDILGLDRFRLVQLAEKFKNDPLYYPVDEEELGIVKVLKDIGITCQGIPGSAAQKIAMRNEIRGLMVAYGAPTLFITLNPSDRDNILVEALCSRDPHVGDLLRGTALSDWQRRLLASRNPGACALFFDRAMKGFTNIILRHGQDQPGLYGRCKAYYGTVEAQGRGTLHCHILVWLEGHPPPERLQSILSTSSDYGNRLFPWLESIMSGDFLTDDGPRIGAEAWNRRLEREVRGTGSIHPGALVGPMIRDLGYETFWNEYYMHINQLLVEYNLHEHHATCWKYLRRGEAKSDANCRMGITGQVFPDTKLDPHTMSVVVKRTHPKMTHYTDLVTFLMKCNHDVKFIGSGAEAEAFMYYVTDYITKSSLSMHVGLSALSYAMTRIEQRLAPNTDPSNNGLLALTDDALASAMTIAVNSMVGHQEISHQQVMSYLIGGGDRYVSDAFQTFNWGGVLSYVDTYWSEVCPENMCLSRESVSLSLSSGNLNISSQRFDYMFRPEDPRYENLCLYDFIAWTKRVPLQTKRVRDSDETRVTGGDRFSVSHPQWESHGVRIRSQSCIPVPLGPPILRTGSGGDAERRAMQILVLFRVWRSAADLKAPTQAWSDALSEFETGLSTRHRLLLANLDTLAQSKEQRDRSINSKRADRMGNRGVRGTFTELVADGVGTDMDSRAMLLGCGSVYGTLDGSPCMDSAYTEESSQRLRQLIGPNCAAAYDLCYLPVVSRLGGSGSSTDPRLLDQPDFLTLEPSDVDEHIRHVVAMRSNHIESVTNTVSRCEVKLPVSESPSMAPHVVVEEIQPDLHGIPISMDISRQYAADARWLHVYNIMRDKGLNTNPEQARAFLILAHHLIAGGDQLLMYIGGMGGTGKSHIVKSIVALFETLGRRRELLIGAPTGIAAVLLEVGAATLHSLIMVNASKRVAVSEKLSEIWRPITYLIVDEISMVGASFFATLSSRIKVAKGDDPLNSSRLFGGVNVVCLGDFCQLKPVNAHALFSSAVICNPAFANVRNNQSLDSMAGIYIWRQFRTVVQLVKNQRHQSDPRFGVVLSNVRTKSWTLPIDNIVWTQAMYLEYFQQQILSNVAKVDPLQLTSFRDAPVVVGNRLLRDALNVKLIQYHSNRLGVEPHLYHSYDLVSGQEPDEALQDIIWGLTPSRCGDMLGKLPLFVGMKVMVTENIAISNGVVNGAEGVVLDIRYHVNAAGRRIADAVYVRIPGCRVSLPGQADIDVVVLSPAATTVPFGFAAYDAAMTVQSFRRRQIPIVPAYSYTDYKSQGRTLGCCIMDLATARGQGVYVMLSRVTSLQGMLILRWFSPTQLFQRPSEELRVELSRLETLDRTTTSAFGDPFAFLDVLYRPAEDSDGASNVSNHDL